MGQQTHMTEDDWQRQATAAAIASARDVISGDDVNKRTMVGSLSDVEWGWICAAAIFAWIKTKSEQATAEGVGYEIPIRTMMYREQAPWEAGAIATILPALGSLKGVEWSKPIGEWSKDQIISFSSQIYRLVDQAMAARDEGAVCSIVKKIDPERMEREISATNKGPLMSRKELNDEITF